MLQHGRPIQLKQRLLFLTTFLVSFFSTLAVHPQAALASTTMLNSPSGANIEVTTDLSQVASGGNRIVQISYSFDPAHNPYPITPTFIHIGHDGWQAVQDIAVTRYSQGGSLTVAYSGSLSIASAVTRLDFAFGDGTRWDNNNGADYHAIPDGWAISWVGNMSPSGTTYLPHPGSNADYATIAVQYYKAGITDVSNVANSAVVAQIWYSVNGGAWSSSMMVFQQKVGNNHQYSGQLNVAYAAGTVIQYTCRFSTDGGLHWYWADNSATGGDGKIYLT
jgi:hypothetical protein